MDVSDHTVNSNSNRFGQLITVSAHEGGDTSEFVDLEIICRKRTFPRVFLNFFYFKLICFRNSTNGYGARICLSRCCLSESFMYSNQVLELTSRVYSFPKAIITSAEERGALDTNMLLLM